MNSVTLIGRLTRDPEVRYGGANQTAVTRFSIAIDRGKNKNGEDMGADYPNIVCFGKTAENVERFCKKGQQVGVVGRIHTDSYEKDGKKIYTTEIYADRVEFLGKASDSDSRPSGGYQQSYSAPAQQGGGDDVPPGFSKLTDDDIPF